MRTMLRRATCRRRFVLRLVLTLVLVLVFTTFTLISNVQSAVRTTAAEAADAVETVADKESPLEQEREDVRQQIEKLRLIIDQLQTNLLAAQKLYQEQEPCRSDYMQNQIDHSELSTAKSYRNEYEVPVYSYFTFGQFYSSESSLGRRVVERPIGSRRQDLIEAIRLGLKRLNPSGSKDFGVQNFVEGFYRTDPVEGTLYHLWFRNQTQLTKVSLLRPHAPLTAVQIESISRESAINIVVPLSGRLEAFRSFLRRFQQVLPNPSAKSVHLSVVIFNGDDWNAVRRELLDFEERTRFSRFHLLNVNASTFSRAVALQAGADHWKGSDDVLLFFCDVDVAFDADFLGRCRRQTQAQHSAYFPMVFSLYNPNITATVRKHPAPNDGEQQQLVISSDIGFWRDFGFGMLCTYRSDFLKLGGFNGLVSTGWGGEDIYLYRKYLRSDLRVIRSPDPGLFHLWHPKQCPTTLTSAQRAACLRSRALSEASHDQLGLLWLGRNSDL